MIADPDYIPSSEQIDAVIAFLPTFERADFVPSKCVIESGTFPYHIFAKELDQFDKAVYDGGFISSFDWPDWQSEAERYFADPEILHAADLQVIRKLITVHVRKERFCEGHLPAMVSCGHMAAILRRLKELREQIAADGFGTPPTSSI